MYIPTPPLTTGASTHPPIQPQIETSADWYPPTTEWPRISDPEGENPHYVTPTEQLLAERYKTNGNYSDKAAFIQNVKHLMRLSTGWHKLSASQKESVDMIAHKLGRIMTGDPNHKDHWDDIAGYAALIARDL